MYSIEIWFSLRDSSIFIIKIQKAGPKQSTINWVRAPVFFPRIVFVESQNPYFYYCLLITFVFRPQFFSILGNNQFLYIDLILTTLLALSLGKATPGPTLTKASPPVSLVSPASIVPLLLQVVQVLVVQALAIYLLYSQGW